MSTEHGIFVVDDAEPQLIMLEAALGGQGRVETFLNARACLRRLEDGVVPEVFVLDVDMPEMDGYELCEAIRLTPSVEHVPVIFISGRDDLESRLMGYDAGGNDYVVKPFNTSELLRKINAARSVNTRQVSLKSQLQETERFSGEMLSTLDEYAVLLQFTRNLNDCSSQDQLVGLLFQLLKAYGLRGLLQIRLPGVELTLSEAGTNRPFEVAVVNNMRAMDRIFEFRNRSAYNYRHLTLVVNNMPTEDPALCGRLRDHLAIVTECASAKLSALATQETVTRLRQQAGDVVTDLRNLVSEVSEEYHRACYVGSEITEKLLGKLTIVFSALGLTDEQENRVAEVVSGAFCDTIDAFQFTEDAQQRLKELATRIAELTGGVEGEAEAGSDSPAGGDSPAPTVELF